MRNSIFSAACIIAASAVSAFAQEATPQQTPATEAPASAPESGEAPAAAGASDAKANELPSVEVVNKPTAVPAKKRVTAKRAKGPVVGTPATSFQPKKEKAASTPAAKFDQEIKNATGHVDGYVAPATMTGTKTATPLIEVPQSISVVTSDRIRDQGAQSIEQALRYVPGVYAEPYGFDSRGDYTMIRGTEPTKFIDGLKRGFYYWDFGKPDPYEFERIEVLRGPASMLYGQHTSGGLINMVTKRPQEESATEIGIEYGSYDHRRLQFDSTGKLSDDGKWLYRVVGIAQEGETQMDFTDSSRLLIDPAITYRPQAGTSVTLMGHVQSDTASASTLGFYPIEGSLYAGPNGRIPTSRNPSSPDFDKYDTDNQSATLLFDHRINDTWSIHHGTRFINYNVATAGNYFDIYGMSPPLDVFLDPARRTLGRIAFASEAEGNIVTTDTNAQARFRTGAVQHKVLTGFDYTHYKYKERDGDYLEAQPFDIYNPVYPTVALPDLSMYLSDGSQDARGVYFQDQMRFGPLIAIAGVRYDSIIDRAVGMDQQESTAVTQRYGLVYETGFGFNPYITYGESFTPTPGTDRNGDFFKPVVGKLREVGFKYQVTPNTLISAAIFQLDEVNRLTTDPINPFFEAQLGATRVEGFEIEGLIAVTSNLNLIASYSYNDARVVSGDGAGTHIEAVPDQLASLWAVYKFTSGMLNGFSVGAGVRYIGQTGDFYYRAPAVTLFDGMIAYETEHWRWALNGSNLEDEIYVGSCGSRGDCFYGQRMNLTTGLTYKF